MALFKNRELSDTIEDLLERERQAVLAGNLEGLTRLVAEKRRLMTLLARRSIPPGKLARLREAARRNQALLEASAHGIRSAAAHVSRLREEKMPLRTYDSSGASRDILQRRSTMEKRA